MCKRGHVTVVPAAAALTPEETDSRSLALDLAVEEYKSLRAESIAAKNNQQTTLTWSLAGIGVLVAGSVAATRPDASGSQAAAYTAVALMFATIAPLIILGSFGIWLGEVERMERVGKYLRERERCSWRAETLDMKHIGEPLRYPTAWENAIFQPKAASGLGKNVFGNVSAVMLFVGAFAASISAAMTVTWMAVTNLSHVEKTTLTGWCVVLLVASGYSFARKLWSLRKSSQDHAA